MGGEVVTPADLIDALLADRDAAIREAVLAERESAAAVCDAMSCDVHARYVDEGGERRLYAAHAMADCAIAIRARSAK